MILLLKTQLLELAGPELLEQGDRLGLIGEQVQLASRNRGRPRLYRCESDHRSSAARSPGSGRPGTRSGSRGCAADAIGCACGSRRWRRRRMRTVLGRTAVCLGERYPRRVSTAAISSSVLPWLSQLEDLFLHLLGRGQPGQGPDRHRQCCGRRVAPPPDDPDVQGVRGGAVDDDLVDEAAEERLLLLRRQAVLTPQLRDRLAGPEEGFSFLGTEPPQGLGVAAARAGAAPRRP